MREDLVNTWKVPVTCQLSLCCGHWLEKEKNLKIPQGDLRGKSRLSVTLLVLIVWFVGGGE